MKKKVIFSSLTLLFSLSAISGFSNGSAGGAVVCLAIAAAFGFLAYRAFKPLHNAECEPAAKISANSVTPPPENSDNLTAPHVVPPVSGSAVKSEFEFVKIKVAGVSFKNEKGASRQTILRKINFHDSPFNEYIELELRPYDYEGSTAYGVYANNLQIGNIPADKVQFVSDNWEHIDSISAINVYGGGRNAEGYAISYGCEITLKLRNE